VKGNDIVKFCLVSNLRTMGKWTTSANEIRNWAYALDGDVYYAGAIKDYSYFDQYDVVMIELTTNLFDVAINLRKYSNTKYVIGLVEGSILPEVDEDQFTKYIEVLNTLDIIGVINDKAKDVLQPYTSKRVEFIGIPYPLEWAQQNNSDTKQAVIELGALSISRGSVYSVAVVKNLRSQSCVSLGFDFVAYPLNNSEVKFYNDLGLDYKLAPIKEWPDYYKEHSRYYMGIHLDSRTTWGRFPLDCASALMPCVGSYGSYSQEILFPDITVNYWEVKKATRLVQQLICDDLFFAYVVSHAQEKIKEFDIPIIRQRFLNLL